MPSLYVGGYFSRAVVSAMYPLYAIESVGTLGMSTPTNITIIGEYTQETVGTLVNVSSSDIELVTVLAFGSYANTESAATLGTVALDAADLITTIVFKSYANVESASTLTSVALADAVLTVTIVFISYANVETAGTLSSVSLSAALLV